MNSGRLKYLFRNMAFFTISSFVSKMLVFLLVPFYTSYLTESEYGIADVMQSTLLLLVPLLSLNMGEAALRFGLEETGDSGSLAEKRSLIFRIGLKQVFKSIVFILCVCLVLFAAVSLWGLKTNPVFILFFFLLYSLDNIYEFMLLYCQGAEEVKIMITGSVFCTITLIVSNLILIMIFRIGIYGYFISQAISFALSSCILIALTGKLIKGRKDDGRHDPILSEKLDREMKVYGKSMLMFSTASWVNNAVDRYYILAMVGSSANGLYSAAYKIPAILQVFQRIFAQAWQMSAVKEYKGEDRDSFFSNTFKIYNAALVIACAGILVLLKPISLFLFRKGFFEAWRLVPPLLISVIFGALEGFLGSICLAFKDARSMGIATSIGAAVNLILNYIGILHFGAFGAALATLISYFTMYAFACIYVKRHVKLYIGWPRIAFSYLILIGISLTHYLMPDRSGDSFVTTYLHNNALGAFVSICLLLVQFILYRDELGQVINKWKRKT